VRSFEVVLATAAFMGACGTGRPPEDANRAALRMPVASPVDPTLRPARLVPVRAGDDDKSYGSEAGGGKRMLVSGVRVIRLAGGGVQSAVDPLPAPPSVTVEVPERLGGGFLFAMGQVIWRADKWLAPLKMLYAAALAPTSLFIGLDRAYVRLVNGAYGAFDARMGTPMDLGPWPGSPDVSRYVAADGWRAVAIADLRGAVATFDAGGKWQPLSLAIQPKDLRLVGDAIVVSGVDANNTQQAYAVQPNGQIAHLQDEEPRIRKAKAETPEDVQRAAKNPLLAAVLDGWPLEGGTALVARDGALTRVRMSDGAVIDTAPDAFPLKPARCHPISLSPPKAPAPPAAAKSPAVPPAAPSAPRGVSPAKASPPAPPVAAKTAVMTRPQAPVPAADDSWDVEPEGEATKVAPPPSPAGPAVTPVMPPVVAPVTPAQSTISAVDLRLIVREMIDQAIAPLQMRLAELERRPMMPSSPYVMQAPPAPAAVAPARPVGTPLAPAVVSPPAPVVAAVQAAPTPYASAMAAPVAQATPASAASAASAAPAPRSLIVAPPPLLDVKAIEMDRSIDVDVRGFDGGRRKRRMIFLFFFAVLVLFGGMFALLADSYTPHH